jgi:hypothetical protein
VTRNHSSRRLLAVAGGVFSLLLAHPGTGAAQSGGQGGYNGGFFIRDAAGNNELRIGGFYQTRYIFNSRDEDGPGNNDLDVGGFQLRRGQINFQGNIFNPRWTFRTRIDASNGGAFSAAYLWFAYTTEDDEFTFRVGQLKPEFLQEEVISDYAQQSAERSSLNEYFTTDFSKGVQLVARPTDRLQVTGTVHGGSYSYRSDYTAAPTSVGFAGRASWVAVGENPSRARSQFGDFQAWDGEQTAALVGLAADYELGRDGFPDLLKWTADGSLESEGVSLFGAIVGQHFSTSGPLSGGVPGAINGVDQLGFIGQAAYMVLPNKLDAFARFESIDFDGAWYRLNQGSVLNGSRNLADDHLSLLTFGVNRYLVKNNARFTLDFVHAFDPVPVSDAGNALLQSDSGDQTTIRAQVQLRF